MKRIDLYRHGPKNNSPDAHGTGVEALLDPSRIPDIEAHARKVFQDAHKGGYSRIEPWTTPVDRARATGDIVYRMLDEETSAGGRRVYVFSPEIHTLLGSCGVDRTTDSVVNLSPRSMSALWADAKRADNYAHLEAEHRPLAAWFAQGLDNPQGWKEDQPDTWNTQDPGITLREIAWRVGSFVYDKLKGSREGTHVVAYGHSGDLELWAALTLQMVQGKDDGSTGTTGEDMKRLFAVLGGALEPLQGYSLVQETERGDVVLTGTGQEAYMVPREILKAQTTLYKNKGISHLVFDARQNIP